MRELILILLLLCDWNGAWPTLANGQPTSPTRSCTRAVFPIGFLYRGEVIACIRLLPQAPCLLSPESVQRHEAGEELVSSSDQPEQETDLLYALKSLQL